MNKYDYLFNLTHFLDASTFVCNDNVNTAKFYKGINYFLIIILNWGEKLASRDSWCERKLNKVQMYNQFLYIKYLIFLKEKKKL